MAEGGAADGRQDLSAGGVLRTLTGGKLAFWCPGCEEMHLVTVEGSAHPIWGFNGDFERPTFTPSVFIRVGHYVPGQEGKPYWCSYEERTGQPLPKAHRCRVCHSFVRSGTIQFLGDCTHALARQTVALQPVA